MHKIAMSRSAAGKLGAEASLETNLRRYEERVLNYMRNPTRCKHCGKPFLYENRRLVFCNNSCAAIYNNSHKVPRHINYGNCANCGAILVHRGKYCNIACQHEYEWKQRVKEVDDSGLFPENKRLHETNRKFVRKYLIEKLGHRCAICGRTDWEGQAIPLIVNHIDGDATNRAVSNLRLVCPNCDAQLSTFKCRGNRISTRTWRKKYYSK